MTEPLDIHLLPAARYAGQDYPELLRLYAAEPPRRRARGREGDRLALYLAMTGSAPVAPGKQDQALEDLARLYYSTPGSVTAAIRRAAEELNKVLLERNLHLAGSNRQGLGMLVQLVMRGGQFTLGVSGPAQAYLITAAGVQHFFDPDHSENSLGQSRATPLSFFQGTLQSGDTLLLIAQPVAEWSDETFAGLYGQGPESLRRRLFGPAVTDVNAVLVHARAGKGVFNLPKPGPAQPPAAATGHRPRSRPADPAPSPVEPPAAPASAGQTPIGEPDKLAGAPGGLPAISPEPVESAAAIALPGSASEAHVAAPSAPAETGWTLASAPAGDLPAEPPAQPAPRPRIVGPAIGRVFGAIGSGLHRVAGKIRSALVRVLPEEALSGIPSSVMAFTALAAPAIIVTVASIAYMRLGRDAQFETLFSQARQIGQRAATQSEAAARHADLEAAFSLLRQAEVYNSNSETVALRSELRRLMDEMELAFRVDYQPAIVGGLSAEANVTRLVVSGDDLYLLDGASGNVLHARLTARGYELDPAFGCGPAAGVPGLGPLVDIALWQKGFEPAGDLLAVDASGTLLFCSNSDEPEKFTLLKPENVELWGQPLGIAVDQSRVYLLDLAGGGVWSYTFNQSSPNPSAADFFNDPNNEEKPDLPNVIDLTINRTDLYLLHADGKISLCFYSGFEGIPTRCSQPDFRDFRPGRENMPLLPPSPFIQLLNTAPPDPSLFLLEAQTQAIYHFSLRNLAFQRQYLPQTELSAAQATAFAVDNIRRYLYLALRNQVFYAVMP